MKPLSVRPSRLARLWAQLRRLKSFLRGSVVLLKRRCTYPGCRACRQGLGHPTWYLSRKVHGQTRLTYLAPRTLPIARRGISQYAHLRAVLEHIAELNAQSLKVSPARPSHRPKRRARPRRSSDGPSR